MAKSVHQCIPVNCVECNSLVTDACYCFNFDSAICQDCDRKAWEKKYGEGKVNMTFQELPVDALFTFHSFSHEFYKKVDDTHCVCVGCGDCIYDNEEIDEPFSVQQRVYPYTAEVAYPNQPIGVGLLDNLDSNDKFQPMALIKVFKDQISQLHDKIKDETISKETRKFLEGVQCGMAFAIVTVEDMAMAKDRFTPRGGK